MLYILLSKKFKAPHYLIFKQIILTPASIITSTKVRDPRTTTRSLRPTPCDKIVVTLATLRVTPIFGPRSMVALYASESLLEVNNDGIFAFLRHGLRDRLRAVHCPSDIVNAIGGWKTAGVGHGYGNGYPLEVLEKWMERISE